MMKKKETIEFLIGENASLRRQRKALVGKCATLESNIEKALLVKDGETKRLMKEVDHLRQTTASANQLYAEESLRADDLEKKLKDSEGLQAEVDALKARVESLELGASLDKSLILKWENNAAENLVRLNNQYEELDAIRTAYNNLAAEYDALIAKNKAGNLSSGVRDV